MERSTVIPEISRIGKLLTKVFFYVGNVGQCTEAPETQGMTATDLARQRYDLETIPGQSLTKEFKTVVGNIQ